jgi:hypothetical protein
MSTVATSRIELCSTGDDCPDRAEPGHTTARGLGANADRERVNGGG